MLLACFSKASKAQNVKAPKAQNVIARPNRPGGEAEISQALKARNVTCWHGENQSESKNTYTALSALGMLFHPTRAVGPGYYIQRFQRFRKQTECSSFLRE